MECRATTVQHSLLHSQLAALALGEDAEEAGGLDVDISFASATDVSRCGKLAALETLLATWYRQTAAGGRNKVRDCCDLISLTSNRACLVPPTSRSSGPGGTAHQYRSFVAYSELCGVWHPMLSLIPCTVRV